MLVRAGNRAPRHARTADKLREQHLRVAAGASVGHALTSSIDVQTCRTAPHGTARQGYGSGTTRSSMTRQA
jgi:hypothetical protein